MLRCNGSRRERLQRTLSSIRDRRAARLTEVAWETERDRWRMSEVGTDDKYFIAKQTEMMKKREEKQQRVGTGGGRERRRWNEGRSRTGDRNRGTQADLTSKSPDLSEALHYWWSCSYQPSFFIKYAEPHTQQRLRFGVWVHKRVVQKPKLKNWQTLFQFTVNWPPPTGNWIGLWFGMTGSGIYVIIIQRNLTTETYKLDTNWNTNLSTLQLKQ